MANPRTFFEHHLPANLLDRVHRVLPEDVTVVFHIVGHGGGDWQVSGSEEGPRVGPADGAPKDCEMWCEASDFMGIVSGALNPREAFFSGRLRILGDIGLMLRLQDVLASAA